MKSIIEEASSVIKAIEKGWASAGKPTEFTVKVLEQPTYNFLGFNVKQAKISFFFDDRTITAVTEKQGRGEGQVRESKRTDGRTTSRRESNQSQQQRRQSDHFTARSTQKTESNQPRSRDSESHNQPRQQQSKPQQARQQRPERSADARMPQRNGANEPTQQRNIENQERAPQVTWSPEVTTMAKDWIQQFLSTIHKGNIQFTTNVQNHILKVDFSGSITGNNQKELMLFKNAAHLLMSSLRNATNSELKQLKVVFSTQG